MEVFARHTHHMPAWGCSRFSRTTGHCLPAMSTARSSTCRSQTSQQASGSSSDACSEGYKASRRACIYSAAAAVLLQGTLPRTALADTYSSEQQHYRLDPPPGWQQTPKQGADVLFQDPEEKGTNLGVTVTPLKISSLDQFGAIEKAGQRILGVERAKESTKSIDMTRQEVRDANGTKFYDFDYVIDTTRGTKRILSYVTIVNKKLYIINGTIKCGKGSCAGLDDVAQLLDTAMKSFVVT